MSRIDEFSKLMQVFVYMLHYYDQEGLLGPEQTDPFADYRLYPADQTPSLNRILFLRDLGFGVSRIREALGRWDQTFILDLLEQKRLEIRNGIRVEQTRLLDIEQAGRDLFKNTISVNYNVSIKAIPCYRVLSLRRTVPDYCGEGVLWKGMSLYTGKYDISMSGHTFTIYHDMGYQERGVDMKICAPVPELGEDGEGFAYRIARAVPYMTGIMVHGPFGNVSSAYRELASWIQEHNQYQITGRSRQTAHRGPWNETDPQDYLTEIQIPLEER